jgi:hypothetical protein
MVISFKMGILSREPARDPLPPVEPVPRPEPDPDPEPVPGTGPDTFPSPVPGDVPAMSALRPSSEATVKADRSQLLALTTNLIN